MPSSFLPQGILAFPSALNILPDILWWLSPSYYSCLCSNVTFSGKVFLTALSKTVWSLLKEKKKCIRQSYAGKDVIQASWNRRGHIRIWHQLHWNKRNRIFKSWVKGEFTDHLSLLIGFTQRKSKLSLLFVTGSSCTAWRKMPT